MYILGLLQRDPRDRMSFDAFFTHPQVDLERAPSAQSLCRATELAGRAEAAERSTDVVLSVKLYSQSLEHFLSALQYIDDQTERERVRAQFRMRVLIICCCFDV